MNGSFGLQSGETPLHLACRGCHSDIVEYLIDFVKQTRDPEVAKTYVNTVNEDGASALHYTGEIAKKDVSKENPTEDKLVVKHLIAADADVSLVTKQVMKNLFLNCNNKIYLLFLNQSVVVSTESRFKSKVTLVLLES